jgi:hypothetical protein
MRAKTGILMLAASCALASCATPSSRAQLSAGRVGCEAGDVKIIDERNLSWVAVCKGKRWSCSGTEGNIACSPLN